jgi:cytoskeletal protein CcmA (bactofilin family)
VTAWLGKGVTIKGDVIGSEDLQIDGHVEGRIELRDHYLLIGPNATVRAHVIARAITIMGAVTGTVTARDTVDLRKSSSVNGDIYAPKVVVAEGAQLNGKVDTLSQAKE